MNTDSYLIKPYKQWDRLDRIRYLLDQWDTIFDADARSGSVGDTVDLPMLPPMANNRAVKELERCLTLLRQVCPGDYRHLQTFRMGCAYRTLDIDVRLRLPSGKHVMEPRRQRRRILPVWLDPARVVRAEVWLEERFRGDVEIPADLWASLGLPADTAEWSEYDAKRRARRLAA